MTRTDIGRLFALIRELYPRIINTLGENTQAAWYLVLEPYDYEDVKAELLRWNRGPKGRTFPDPRECIPETYRPPAENNQQNSYNVLPEDALASYNSMCEKCWTWWKNTTLFPAAELERLLRHYESMPQTPRLQAEIRRGREIIGKVRREMEQEEP